MPDETQPSSSVTAQPVVPAAKPGLGQIFVSVAIFGLAYAMIWALIFKEVPTGNRDLFNIALGAVLTKMSDIVAYFINSTFGSARKDETIAKATATVERATRS